MSDKRVVLSQSDYQELKTARDWCRDNDMTGLLSFYDSQLGYLAYRYSLPAGAEEYRRYDEEEGSPHGRDRSR